MSAIQTQPDASLDRFVALIAAGDPKARAMLAILRALSPLEADAWLEVGRRMVRTVSSSSI